MWELRLGDDTDDFCPKCKRLTNHSIVSLVEGKPGKVRCRACYHEQMFRDCVPPPSKKELKLKAELFNQVLAGNAPPVAAVPETEDAAGADVVASAADPKPAAGRKKKA